MKIAEILKMAEEKNMALHIRFSVPGDVVLESATGRASAPNIKRVAETHRNTMWNVREMPMGKNAKILYVTEA